MTRPVRVVPHDPAWAAEYERAADVVRQCLGDVVVRTHHVGSTAIPRIHAKPIIDILVEVTGIEAVDSRNDAMLHAGFDAKGEHGIPGRRYFRMNGANGERTHHVHVFAASSEEVRRHLDFRDYLRAHPSVAREYSDHKRRLAAQHPGDSQAYTVAKGDFIARVDEAAAAWRASSGPRRDGRETVVPAADTHDSQ